MSVNLVKISVVEMASFEASIEAQPSTYQNSALLDKFCFRDFVITNFNNNFMWIANKLTLENIKNKTKNTQFRFIQSSPDDRHCEHSAKWHLN